MNSFDQHPTKHNLEQVLDEGCSDNTADLETRNKNNIGVLRILLLTLSFPRSKRTFSQPFKDKCIREGVRVGSIIILHPSKLWKAKSFNISGEDAGLKLIDLGQFLQYRSGVGPMREETPLQLRHGFRHNLEIRTLKATRHAFNLQMRWRWNETYWTDSIIRAWKYFR